jgi:hypothetical protein
MSLQTLAITGTILSVVREITRMKKKNEKHIILESDRECATRILIYVMDVFWKTARIRHHTVVCNDIYG